MAMCSSILKIFFWCAANSLWDRLKEQRTACLSERIPTTGVPCFTASIAYSIWKIRPCGLQVMQSVSYWLVYIAATPRPARREAGGEGVGEGGWALGGQSP